MANAPSSVSEAFLHDPELHDRWFRAKIEKALNSSEPFIPHDEVMEIIREKLFKYAPDLDL